MPLVNVEQYLRDDGKLEIRVHNCSGLHAGNDRTTTGSELGGDLVFHGGSSDDEQPCAVIFSLRSSHPHMFYYRGRATNLTQTGTRTYLTPSLAAMTNEEERAAVVSASEKEWGAHGLSSVAPGASGATTGPGPGVGGGSFASYSPGRGGDESTMGPSPSNSGVFGSSGTTGAVVAAASRPLLVREEIPDGVLLPGERRTFVLDLDDPQYLRDYFQVRVQVREREARRTHHHQKSQKPKTPLSQQAQTNQTPNRRRATAAPVRSPHTPPPPAVSLPMPLPPSPSSVSASGPLAPERVSEAGSSYGPALMRATTVAFNAELPPTPSAESRGGGATPKPAPRLGSPGLVDSHLPPSRAAAGQLHRVDASSEDDDDEDELTSSAVPYSRMTINVASEPTTSPARDSMSQDGRRRPSAPTLTEEDEDDAEEYDVGTNSMTRRWRRVNRSTSNSHSRFSDVPEPPAYPLEDPPPTISSRVNGAQAGAPGGRRVSVHTDSPSLDWDGSLLDSTDSSSASASRTDPQTPLPLHTHSSVSATAATAPPPMLTVYYSRLGDENKCVEKARKWLKRESKSYTTWQDNFIKTAVKLEKKRDGLVPDTLVNGGPQGAVCARLLPPALGDPVRWRRDPLPGVDRVSAEAFSNVSIVRSRAAFSRYYSAILRDEVGASKVASVIVDRTAPYAATHTNGVSKEAQKMFNESRMGEGVVMQPLRWQLFVPRRLHHQHPLITPRAALGDLPLTSPSSTIWHGDHSQSSSQSQRLLASWPPPATEDAVSGHHTPTDDVVAAARRREAVAHEATVPRRASPGSAGDGEAWGDMSHPLGGSALRAGRGLALLDDSASASGNFDQAEMDAVSPSEAHSWSGHAVSADGLMDSRGGASVSSAGAPLPSSLAAESHHSRGPSPASPPPPMNFAATRSFLPMVGVERTATLDPASAEAFAGGSYSPELSDMPGQSSEFLGSPLIAFANAPRPAKDTTLWGSLMSTGSRGTAGSPLVDELGASGRYTRTPPGMVPRVAPLPSPSANAGPLPCLSPASTAAAAAVLESSQRSQGAAEEGFVNNSFSRINSYLKSYLSSSRDKTSPESGPMGASEKGLPQSEMYPTEGPVEVPSSASLASMPCPTVVESSGLMSPLEESGFGLSSQTGMRPLTAAPPSNLLKRPPAAAPPPASVMSSPRRGHGYLGERAMQGGALGTIALTASLVVELVMVLVGRLHNMVSPVAGQAVSTIAEQMPGILSAVWNFMVDVVLADDNVKLLQKVMVPLLGAMGVWLMVVMVWSSGSSVMIESDIDRPL